MSIAYSLMPHDCIVLGVGGFGSGTLYHLARRGARVLGIEQFGIAHDRGSSHGETRIIRKAYFEHPDYVPLLLRAYELWRTLADECGRELYRETGLLLCGAESGTAISGARLAAERHRLRLDSLDEQEASRSFPGFRFPEGSSIVFEPEAGALAVEECVRAHIQGAIAHGAEFKSNERVIDWSATDSHVEVRTDRGTYRAASLVITAGPWAGSVIRELGVPLEVARKITFWYPFAGETDRNADVQRPVFFYDLPEGEFYGLPGADGASMKVAEHTGGSAVTDPTQVNRECLADDAPPVNRFVERCLPGVRPEPLRHSVCMYTRTPDCHFLVDRHPGHANVFLGAGFSGHGFKFTSVIGEALAELALEGRTDKPIRFLGLARF